MTYFPNPLDGHIKSEAEKRRDSEVVEINHPINMDWKKYILLEQEISEQKELIKELVGALDDIENFHDRDFEQLEKKWGFLSWTCCGQKRKLAQAALKQYREARKEG